MLLLEPPGMLSAARRCPGGAAGTPPAGAGIARGRGVGERLAPCPSHPTGAAPAGWGRLERVKSFPSSCCSPLNATAFL